MDSITLTQSTTEKISVDERVRNPSRPVELSSQPGQPIKVTFEDPWINKNLVKGL